MEDGDLVTALRAGDEGAFRALVERYHPAMFRVASFYVPSRAVAEEVVQETWLAVVEGLDRFEGRSSLKTWLFRILANRARSRGVLERRAVPFSTVGADDDDPTVAPERFRGPGHLWAGHWSDPPRRWSDVPAERLQDAETRAAVVDAIRELPPHQREVITLRDVEGWTAEEVCSALDITSGNQRVLLHRARARVRSALEQRFSEGVQV